MKNYTSKRSSKRRLRIFTRKEKLLAVMRVLDGEPRTKVGDEMSIPESTLRGWLKTPAIIAAVKAFEEHAMKNIVCPSAAMGISDNWWTNYDVDDTAAVQDVINFSKYRNSYNSDSENSEQQVTSSASTSGSEADFSTPKQGDEQYSWVYDEYTSTVDVDNSSSSVKGRVSKRKRTRSDCCFHDLPIKRRKANDLLSFGGKRVEDFESRNCKDLLCELAQRDALSHDLFVYLLEVLE